MSGLNKRAVYLFWIRSFSIVPFFIFLLYGLFWVRLSSVINSNENLSLPVIVSIIISPLFLLGVVIILGVITYVWSILSVNAWRYELKDTEYRAERGVLNKRYVSIPYSRIQNVDIHRSLLARVLGLSEIKIQTAGYGASGGYAGGSEGSIPGLELKEAEHVREEIMKKVNQVKSNSVT